MQAGNVERAEQRMNEEDGRLAKHSTECSHGINWERKRISTTDDAGRSQDDETKSERKKTTEHL